jgi:hypothetical protein
MLNEKFRRLKNMKTNSQTNGQKVTDSAVIISQEDAIVFSKLLPDRNMPKFEKVVGMIAYAQYALQKHQYIESYYREEGQSPSEDLLKSIILTFKNENGSALETLKDNSRNLLKEYAKEYAKSVAHANIINPIKKEVHKRTRFWQGVAASSLGALVYSLLVAVIIFIATAAMPETKFSKIVRILFESNQELIDKSTEQGIEGQPSK